jgi:hypothetical protein
VARAALQNVPFIHGNEKLIYPESITVHDLAISCLKRHSTEITTSFLQRGNKIIFYMCPTTEFTFSSWVYNTTTSNCTLFWMNWRNSVILNFLLPTFSCSHSNKHPASWYRKPSSQLILSN